MLAARPAISAAPVPSSAVVPVAPAAAALHAPLVPAPAADTVRRVPAPADRPPAAAVPVSPPVVATAPAAVAATAPQDEPVQLRSELPEPILRSIPAIAMGGYMYSKNPADRLLLIDKVLRHEGEEVAPGLVLEKLLPKAAVFTFKGYRYRVPY